MNRTYWINTTGTRLFLLSLENYEPEEFEKLMFGLVPCSWFEYILFKTTRINLKAEDKLQWVKAYWRKKLHGN